MTLLYFVTHYIETKKKKKMPKIKTTEFNNLCNLYKIQLFFYHDSLFKRAEFNSNSE
jgi:hypothetical protein